MKRSLFLFSAFLSLSFPTSLRAQDVVPLRSAVREGYSRVVLGWTENVTYTLDETQKGQAILTFSSKADLDSKDADFKALANISSVQVLSTDPLKISFSIPESSNVRAFKIGKRVILDVYDRDNTVETKSKKTPQANPPEKPVEVVAAPPVVNKTKNAPPAAPPAYVLVPEQLPVKKNIDVAPPSQDVSPKNAKLEKAVEQENHVISVRSTKTFNMAVFENYGYLWMVMDDKASYLVPDLSSPKPELFSSFEPVESQDAIIYRTALPEDAFLVMKGTGGGLIWNIVMGNNVAAAEPVAMMREIPSTQGVVRGGKIIWPLKGIGKIVDFKDSVTGEKLTAVTVANSDQLSGDFQSFVDFDVLKSPIGLVIRPKVDDLRVEKTSRGIEIYRSAGLAIASSQQVEAARLFHETVKQEDGRGLLFEMPDQVHHDEHADSHSDSQGGADAQAQAHFMEDDAKALLRFNEWKLGTNKAGLNHTENILLSGLASKPPAEKIEGLLTLGKLFLSQGRGAEALGYFEYAQIELPELLKSPEFLALRGVAEALDWKSEAALQDLLHEGLNDLDEIKYWKAYTLADLGDWQQAVKLLPTSYKTLYSYPPNIANRLAIVLAEINLRDGKVKQAEELLALIEHNDDALSDPMFAALKYMRGEAARQKGDKVEAKETWKELTQDKDDLYRTKAGLALTILLANDKEIDRAEQIDRLERLRYAWRGDELEAQVNYWLGLAYFGEKNFIKGLSIMRDAAGIDGDSELSQKITGEMSRTFSDLFLGDDLKNVSATDAVALYEQFKELTPVGDEGNKMVQMLAEHMVRADLLGRASDLLSYQVDHRLEGQEKLRVAIHLAAIELLDKKPQKAINALGKATETLKLLSSSPENEKRKREIELLRIRAYAQNKQFDKALALLENVEQDKTSHRLRADIAWQAGYWNEAADALKTVLIEDEISPTQPPTVQQADLILNRAIALSLDNDRIALSNMREKYSDLMLQTQKARQFEVITRPRRSSALADRETLMSAVSEVDLFKDFLESYRESAP